MPLSVRHSGAPRPIFVGFAGRIGAGKTSAARYLAARYGLQYRRYSQVLRQWVSPADRSRETLQELGWRIMSGGLQAELNSRVLATLDRSQGGAIDGLRHPTDFETLSGAFGGDFHLIFIEAPELTRWERMKSQLPTLAEFRDVDSREVERYVDTLRQQADAVITNDGTLEHLEHEIETRVIPWTNGVHV